MSALMEEKKSQEETAPQETQNQALPEDETVLAKWKELSGMYASRPRLASTLANTQLEISEENGVKVVSFFVTNESQKQWIEEKLLRELETSFRRMTACPRINLAVSVTPEAEHEEIPYMPADKARDLIKKNPEVREFVAALGLDTK